jgi:hypothetical protein
MEKDDWIPLTQLNNNKTTYMKWQKYLWMPNLEKLILEVI